MGDSAGVRCIGRCRLLSGMPAFVQLLRRLRRKHVDDCAEDAEDPGSWKEVKDFVINWDVKGEWPEYAFNGHVPRVEASWAWDIGSFQCK